MAYVNYVRESVAFMEYASDERISGSEQLLWHALFHVMNQRAKGSNWPEGFISIPNARILFYAQFGEDTLISARNKLKQRGLIDYMPGKKNKQSPQYKLNYLTAELCTDRPQNAESMPEYSGNMPGNAGGNMPGNAGGNMPGNAGGNMPGIYINLNDNRNPNRSPNAYEDDDHEEEEYKRAREAMGRCVDQTYRQCLGREPVPIERQQLITAALGMEMPMDMVEQAIGRAALRFAKSPALYAMELMRSWEYYKIYTPQDLAEHDRR